MSVAEPFPRVSVVVPAHNEEAVIERCLQSLLAGTQPGELEVIVVCNGCLDHTADVARRTAPGAVVIELPAASKVAALRAGDESARYFPRFYVDADVQLSSEALRSVASVLRQGEVQCAAPVPRFDLGGRPWAIRAFYDIWLSIPYHAEQMVGSGVYALSEEGRSRFATFPDLTADDQFVQQLFDISERRAVPAAQFTVHAPRSVRGLVNMRARAYRGNRELALSGLTLSAPPPSGAKSALRKALQPVNIPAVAVYAGVNLVAKALARRRRRPLWERDDSGRRPPSGMAGGLSLSPVGQEASVCYVTSHYPALSHTFVMREVVGARGSGVNVCTVSVHQADPSHLLAEADRREAATTWNIFPLDKRAFLVTHAKTVLRHPRAYVRTAAHAFASSPPGLRARLWQLIYFAEAVALWDHAEQKGVTHFHAHLANVAADISWLASALGNAIDPTKGWRWSFTMHGSGEFYAVQRFNLRRKVAAADAVVCISEYTKSQMMYVSDPEHWHKLDVVHCGVDLDRYPYVGATEKPYLSLLCVCRLVAEKGLDLLLDALAMLREDGTDARLVLVGSGPLEGQLRRRAELLGLDGSVSFVGAVGQDEMATYYAAADIFCLPSFAEGVPVVMMEAMATGRPVVASRITGIPELVEEGTSGLLVTPGNIEQLTAALRALAASPELRERLGRAGRLVVEKSFSSRRSAEQMASLFKQMLPRGGGHGSDKASVSPVPERSPVAGA